MDGIWEEPPRISRSILWAERLDELRQHPKRWARFDDVAMNSASQIKRGTMSTARPGEFEVQRHNLNQPRKSRCTMYIRYLGPVDDD